MDFLTQLKKSVSVLKDFGEIERIDGLLKNYIYHSQEPCGVTRSVIQLLVNELNKVSLNLVYYLLLTLKILLKAKTFSFFFNQQDTMDSRGVKNHMWL